MQKCDILPKPRGYKVRPLRREPWILMICKHIKISDKNFYDFINLRFELNLKVGFVLLINGRNKNFYFVYFWQLEMLKNYWIRVFTSFEGYKWCNVQSLSLAVRGKSWRHQIYVRPTNLRSSFRADWRKLPKYWCKN